MRHQAALENFSMMALGVVDKHFANLQPSYIAAHFDLKFEIRLPQMSLSGNCGDFLFSPNLALEGNAL